MDLLALLVLVLIIGLLWWALTTVLGAFAVPAPVVAVAKVIFVVIVVLYLLQFLGFSPLRLPRA